MKVTFEGELRSVVSKDYEFEGKKGTSHNATVEVEGQSFYFKTTKKVAEDFTKGFIVKGQQCVFTADYSPAYKSMRITAVV